MAENESKIVQEEMKEEELLEQRVDFFSYYRRLRSNYFSDTETIYETKLTREVFDLKLQQLSQDKKQSEFENFILAVAARQITPNIKPQTGPDGGGDGKVDGETYPVDEAVSDKWWVSDGCTGDQRWAIAISVQKKWQFKVESDVDKVVKTGRGYTKLLFFTNQKIKSSVRLSKEDELTKKYGITVSIFDGTWCSFVVFEQGSLDVALEKLNFSEEYRKKTVIEGPLDKKRREQLKALEEGFITRNIAKFDTDYVDDLIDACLLSRCLELPRQETEGRFRRALREAKVHGSSIQTFNIIYNHAWTSFFWFNDIEATYSDYLELKEYTDKHPTIHTIERLTNIVTNLENVTRLGLFDIDKFEPEILYIKELRNREGLPSVCQLFLDLYISEHRLLQLIEQDDNLSEEIKHLSDLLEESAHYPEIGFSAQFQIVEMLGRLITDEPAFEELVDKLASITSSRESEIQGAMVHFTRAQALMEKNSNVPAIKHLGHCVQAFVKEGCESEYVKSCGYMGIALYNEELPYSAEAYLIKAASVLVKEFYTNGTISHLLITLLSKLCEIELMLGRLIMYLNWRELLYVISHNGEEYLKKEFIERDLTEDSGWACHLAASDISIPEVSLLPAIFERCDMPISANYLKYALGYNEEVDRKYIDTVNDNWTELLLQQPIHQQFIGEFNIATDGNVSLSTLVHNCRFVVSYENSVENQLVAETFLASVETLLSTFENFDLVILTKEIKVDIIETEESSSMSQGASNSSFLFNVNHSKLSDKEYWECFSFFMAYFFTQSTASKEQDVLELIKDRHEKEKIMDRVSSLMVLYQSVYSVLGNKFKYSISKWKRDNDKVYPCRSTSSRGVASSRHTSSQQNMSVYTISENMQWWNESGWSGLGFLYDQYFQKPPILALLFKDITKGKRIINELRQMSSPTHSGFEVQLIKGVDKDHPSWYRVCLTPKVPDSSNGEGRYVTVMCRKHLMTPNNSQNLDAFEREYKKYGKCRLLALAFDDSKGVVGEVNLRESFEFDSVIIVDAWRVSIKDSCRYAFEWDDNPIIPASEAQSAPVLELLATLREVQKKTS